MAELREGTAAEAGMLPDRIEHIRTLARDWVERGDTPSLVVLAARRGVIVLHEAFGRLRPEPDARPLRVDSVFPISSISKPITATAAMMLVEDGLLGLNRPIRDYLPEITGAGSEEVLVHHLLTHTSGYCDEEMAPIVAQKIKEGADPGPCEPTQHPAVHQRLSVYYPHPVSRPAGTEMIYCNANFDLVAEIVRRLTGRPLHDFARERIFEPLGMHDSSYVVPDAVRARIVKRPPHAPLVQNPLGLPGIDSREREETPSGSGGVFSTARDLAAFCQMFLNGGTYGRARILSRPTVAAMMRNQIPGIAAQWFGTLHRKEGSYGYGWIVESNEKWKYWTGSLPPIGTFGHGGAGGCSMWIDPANEIVGVYLSVVMRITAAFEHMWNLDLFQNAVTAAVAD
jgi:CubicO group peptidase (beta-lactamase class C family)